MLRTLGSVLLLSLSLAACQTIAPSALSAVETRDLHVTSVEVKVPETAPISWTSAEDDYLRARGLSQTDPALTRTSEVKAYLRDRAGGRLKAAIERVIAKRDPGTRPVRLVVTLANVAIPSAAERVIIGGASTLAATVELYDARTQALLTAYKGAVGVDATAGGLTGVVLDAALVSTGVIDDLYDRVAGNYAVGFDRWLSAPTRGGA